MLPTFRVPFGNERRDEVSLVSNICRSVSKRAPFDTSSPESKRVPFYVAGLFPDPVIRPSRLPRQKSEFTLQYFGEEEKLADG
jgi:hypothetical protein